MKKVISWLAAALWNASEFTGIGLGSLAPYVFGALPIIAPEAVTK